MPLKGLPRPHRELSGPERKQWQRGAMPAYRGLTSGEDGGPYSLGRICPTHCRMSGALRPERRGAGGASMGAAIPKHALRTIMQLWEQGASLLALMVKHPPARRETWVRSPGREDPLEEGLATHPSVLVWRIPMDRGSWWAAVGRDRSTKHSPE